MKEHRIKFLPSAEVDIDDALDYFMDKDMNAATTFLDDIERATKQLSAFPETAPYSKDAKLSMSGYRVLLLEYGYLMFYRISRTMCTFSG